jgi:hypothetical protein
MPETTKTTNNLITWLTPEQAIKQIGLNLSVEQINQYAQEKTNNLTPEEQFASLGLFFERQKYEAGETAFLRILAPDHSSISEDLEQFTIRIVLTLFPQEKTVNQRQVMVAASIVDDLPLAELTNWAEFEPLPKPIERILAQLQADLPNHRYRSQIKENQAKPKSSRQSKSPQPETHQPPQNTQINLFGL